MSVVIPVRNGEDYIREAIVSALRQGDSLCQILVVDDGSTDQTRERVLEIDDPKVELQDSAGSRAGVSAVRNFGFAQVQSPWVMFLDADDRLQEGAFDALLAAATPRDVGIYGDYHRIDESGQSIGQRRLLRKRQKPSGDILQSLLGGNFIVNGGVMLVNTQCFKELGGFDESLAYAEDWLAWCRLSAEGRIAYVPGLHVLDYRVHTKSVMMKRPLTLGDCLPAVKAVFADPKINGLVPSDVRAGLKAKAIAHMQAYCMSQDLRAKRYKSATSALVQCLVKQPKYFPRMALMAAAALAGI